MGTLPRYVLTSYVVHSAALEHTSAAPLPLPDPRPSGLVLLLEPHAAATIRIEMHFMPVDARARPMSRWSDPLIHRRESAKIEGCGGWLVCSSSSRVAITRRVVTMAMVAMEATTPRPALLAWGSRTHVASTPAITAAQAPR